MSEGEIAEITKLLYTRTYAPDTPIVRAGDTGGAMYLIESGEATVALAAGKTTVLREGDFFGEMALFEGRRHKHDVVARTRCRVLVLDTDSLMRLSRRHPEILGAIKQAAKQRKEAEAANTGQSHRRKSRDAGTESKRDEPAAL